MDLSRELRSLEQVDNVSRQSAESVVHASTFRHGQLEPLALSEEDRQVNALGPVPVLFGHELRRALERDPLKGSLSERDRQMVQAGAELMARAMQLWVRAQEAGSIDQLGSTE